MEIFAKEFDLLLLIKNSFTRLEVSPLEEGFSQSFYFSKHARDSKNEHKQMPRKLQSHINTKFCYYKLKGILLGNHSM